MEKRSPYKIICAAIAVALLVGCASLPPAQPIKDLGSIAGTWKEKSGGTMDISPHGTYLFRRGGRDTPGTISVKDGKAITNRGTVYTLHEVDGKTIMSSSSPRGNVREWSRVQ